MNQHRIPFTRFALAFVFLGAGVAGCRGSDVDPEILAGGTPGFAVAGDDGLLAGNNDSPALEPQPELPGDNDSPGLEPQPEGGVCVSFEGFEHCPLGGAYVATSDDGETLEVGNLAAADKDGVAIHLPEVTEFSVTGEVTIDDKSTLVARAMSDGVSSGTMTVQAGADGYAVSATFTGNGEASTYRVNLYADNALVQSIENVPSGESAIMVGQLKYFVDGMEVSEWQFRMALWEFAVLVSGPNTGACHITAGAPEGAKMDVRMADGKTVVVDRIELEEEVPAFGSYPYLTFNRIDFTASGGRIALEGETVK